MLEAGLNLLVIQKCLGHRSPTTTAIYAHVTTAPTEAVTSTIEGVIAKVL